MQLTKRVLARLKSPYPLGLLALDGKQCVVGSTEDHGPVVMAAPPYDEAIEIVPGPGGCMALVPDAERPGELYAIMGCFPGYKFQTGAIYRIGREAGQWTRTKLADLPFAHRIDFVTRGGNRYLMAATLAADKSDPSDWSRPGTLYACRVPRQPEEQWSLVPVLENIHRNHGLLVQRFEGRRSILVSGTEGLFASNLEQPGGSWAFKTVLRDEVSEVVVLDVDGDGEDELITIEPFHGNFLRVYKRFPGRYEKAWEGEIAFGHGLLAGRLGGAPSILVSNRAESRDLLLFQFPQGARPSGRGLSEPTRTVVDPGAGAANMLILSHNGEDRIFSTNQSAGEIAVYSAAP